MSFTHSIELDNCWDIELEGDNFALKMPFNPLIYCLPSGSTTIGFIHFFEDGYPVYRAVGELDAVKHVFGEFGEEPYTELQGRITVG